MDRIDLRGVSGYHGLWRDVLRPMVLIRDKFTCFICCKTSAGNHVHHLTKNKQTTNLRELITLCSKCHVRVENSKFVVKSDFKAKESEELQAILNTILCN